MTVFNYGDVYLVRFHPSIGSELKRYRPAVVVSEKVNKIDDRFIAIVPLTTQSTKSSSGLSKYNLNIKSANYDFLEKDSSALSWYLNTVDSNRLVQYLGRLTEIDIRRLEEKVLGVFKRTKKD